MISIYSRYFLNDHKWDLNGWQLSCFHTNFILFLRCILFQGIFIYLFPTTQTNFILGAAGFAYRGFIVVVFDFQYVFGAGKVSSGKFHGSLTSWWSASLPLVTVFISDGDSWSDVFHTATYRW